MTMSMPYLLGAVAVCAAVTFGLRALPFALLQGNFSDCILDFRRFGIELGGYVQAGLEEMVQAYNVKFGLDKPLWQQYVTYLGDVLHFDFGYSLMQYPTTVLDIIRVAMPWTIGLLLCSTLIAFAIGTVVGGLLGWSRSPQLIQFLLPPLLMFSVIPYYLFGLILVYLLAFQLKIFPMSGSAQYGDGISFGSGLVIYVRECLLVLA